MPSWLLSAGGWFQNLWYNLLEALGVRKVPDISQINAQLWTGAAITSDADVEYLAHVGITADIDCRLEFDDQSLVSSYDDLPPTPPSLPLHPKIQYCYDGVADDGQPKPVSWFQTAWTFGEPVLQSGGVLLSHCAAGVNRGPSMAYFFLRAHWRMTGDDAMALLRAKRPVVNVAYRGDADEAIIALKLG